MSSHASSFGLKRICLLITTVHLVVSGKSQANALSSTNLSGMRQKYTIPKLLHLPQSHQAHLTISNKTCTDIQKTGEFCPYQNRFAIVNLWQNAKAMNNYIDLNVRSSSPWVWTRNPEESKHGLPVACCACHNCVGFIQLTQEFYRQQNFYSVQVTYPVSRYLQSQRLIDIPISCTCANRGF